MILLFAFKLCHYFLEFMSFKDTAIDSYTMKSNCQIIIQNFKFRILVAENLWSLANGILGNNVRATVTWRR